MTKIELEKKLKNKGVREDSYSLQGGFPNEAYCLNATEIDWEVYYSERGSKSGLKTFNSESEACKYFYGLLVN